MKNVKPEISNSEFSINDKFPNFVIFQTESGKVNIDVFFQNDTLWLTQKKIAELFEKGRSTITEHLKNIFNEGELDENSVCRNFRHTAEDGKIYDTKYYNLRAITAVGYRVNSHRATEFRKWATEILHEFIVKGFFATTQNKMHWAIQGKTAAEIIYTEADATKIYMGLKTWKNAPDSKVLKSDVSIAKNYLEEEHLKELQRIVSAYLDLAENRDERGIVMNMKDWIVYLDKFLELSDYPILLHKGKISALEAKIKAEKEYDKFRVEQDKNYISDFDKEIMKQLKEKKDE